jgi:Autophagy receptor ATG43
MASNLPIEIASTLQGASINRHPDARLDVNPSTAASRKNPVRISSSADLSDVDDEIPASFLRPIPRRTTLPPLPDLRFEQSYLRSIEKATTWPQVAWITFRDQVSDSMRDTT